MSKFLTHILIFAMYFICGQIITVSLPLGPDLNPLVFYHFSLFMDSPKTNTLAPHTIDKLKKVSWRKFSPFCKNISV
jgi:hypothetical protein